MSAIIRVDERIITRILIAAVLFLATTFGGMAFFGMGSGGVHMEETCGSMPCGPMDHGPAPLDCLNHCLDQAAPSTVVPAPAAVPPLVLLVVLLLLADRSAAVGIFPVRSRRLEEAIGIGLRHRSLSTVILRN